MSEIIPLSEDALNRFRITHSDRDLRPLLRRLHRLPHLHRAKIDDDESTLESSGEVDMVRMELMKWRGGIERVLTSVGNLERQRKTYLRRADETVAFTSEQRETLKAEQELLVQTRVQRDRHIKCDEVAGKITARGRTRKELNEQIAAVQASLEDHRASHAQYLQATATRIEIFSQITKLVEDCRGTTLPIETQTSIAALDVPEPEAMDVDEPNNPAHTTSNRLSGAALPFQPSTSSSHTSRASTPVDSAKPRLPSSSSSHPLPSRPTRPSLGNTSTSTASLPSSPAPLAARTLTPTSGHARLPGSSSNLPNRPSALRSATTPGIYGSLEEGEVGEDGEVVEGSAGKRGIAGQGDGRNIRISRTRGT